MRRTRSTRSFGASCAGLGAGLNGVFLKSSGARKPALSCVMRTTVSQPIPITLRIISAAAMTYVAKSGLSKLSVSMMVPPLCVDLLLRHRPRMRGLIGRQHLRAFHLGIFLRRRERGVPEQFLHAPQISA